MKVIRDKPFNIIITERVLLTITRVRIGEETIFCEVSNDDVVHGKIFPVKEYTSCNLWQTVDNIDPVLVKRIGEAIELHEQKTGNI